MAIVTHLPPLPINKGMPATLSLLNVEHNMEHALTCIYYAFAEFLYSKTRELTPAWLNKCPSNHLEQEYVIFQGPGVASDLWVAVLQQCIEPEERHGWGQNELWFDLIKYS